MENDPLNFREYINCYKEINGYYLDKNKSQFKKCYDTCQTCEIKGDFNSHDCLLCKKNFIPIKMKYTNYNNCYENDVSKIIKQILSNSTKTKEEETKKYDIILEYIESLITSENFNKALIDKGKDDLFEMEKMLITFTTIENQKNNINNNTTTIDFGDCELLLRKYYNFSNNDTIYIKKLDINQEGFKIPKIEYDVYSKISGNKLKKLNLSICDTSKILIFIPMKITKNIDELNINSGYYNDICYPATTDSGNDIPLKDRKQEFIDGKKTICQEDCDFSDYDYIAQRVKCSCKVQESSSTFNDMKINKDKLYKNFIDINNIANVKILGCYTKLFIKDGLIKNIGNYFMLIIILFHFFSIIIFFVKQYKKLKEKIIRISFELKI